MESTDLHPGGAGEGAEVYGRHDGSGSKGTRSFGWLGARYEESPFEKFGTNLKYLDAGHKSRVYDGGNTDIRLLRPSSTATTVRGVATAAVVAQFRMGWKDYVCDLVVNKRKDKNAFCLHEVTLKEKLSDTIKTPTGGASIGESARPVMSIIAQRLAEVYTKKCGNHSG